MNKQLSPEELVTVQAVPMTRREKLMRFAQIIRTQTSHLFLYNNLEDHDDVSQDSIGITNTAFAVATADPIFRDAGLTGETLGVAKRFFELSRDDLHEFSCDCGGALTNTQMADRIEKIAC